MTLTWLESIVGCFSFFKKWLRVATKHVPSLGKATLPRGMLLPAPNSWALKFLICPRMSISSLTEEPTPSSWA